MGYVTVVDKKHETVTFGDLDIGETFRYKDKIYLKYCQSMDMDNTFVFGCNFTVELEQGDRVTRVNCKLVVEDEYE